MKNFLILSGGAFRGSFQVGAVEYLLDKGFKFDKVFGISTGAINGSLVAQGKIRELKSFWNKVHTNGQSEVFESIIGNFENDKLKVSFSRLRKLLTSNISIFQLLRGGALSQLINNAELIQGLFNMNPLKTKLTEVLELDGFISDYYCGSVEYSTGKYNLLNNSQFFNLDNLVNSIVASASMPVISNPITSIRTYEGAYFNSLDGGVRTSSPIGDAIKHMNGEECQFFIVNCNSGYNIPSYEKMGILEILTRTVDIMTSQIFLQDVNTFMVINELSDGVKYKKIPYVLIQPTDNLLGDPLKTELIPERYEHGVELAKLKLKQSNIIYNG